MEEKLLKFAGKVQDNRYISAISEGLMAMFPILLLGSFALLFAVLPIEAWSNFIVKIGLQPYLFAIQSLTVNTVSLYAAFSIAYKLADSFDEEGLIPGALSVFSFLILTPLLEGAIDPSWLSAQGLFIAIIAGLLSTKLYVFLKQNDVTIKMPESVPGFVQNTFASLIPVFIVGVLAMLISWIFSFTSYGSLAELVYSLVAEPLLGLSGSVWSLVIIVLVQMVLWFFGVHGSLVVSTFIQTLYVPLDINQQAAVVEGTANSDLPNILGQGFYSVFSGIGGAGGTLSLLLVIFVLGKSTQYKTLGNLSLVPGMFTVNEPIIFGFPLIMNPIMAVPFITVPVIQTLGAYAAIAVGLVPRLNGVNPGFGLPVFVNGFMTGGWRVSLLQLVLVILGAFVYYPFFRMADKKAFSEEK